MIQAQPEISKEFILDYLTQEEIMSRYLGLDVEKTTLFCSPLRDDKYPTCSVAYIGDRLIFRDWSEDRSFDCFGIVERMYGVNFYDALQIIARDFNLVKNVRLGKKKEITVHKRVIQQVRKEKSDIQVRVDKFSKTNIAYLKQYHITSEQCKRFNVYHPSHVWLNGKLYYVQCDNNPALAYYFGLDEKGNPKWKIYFYKSEYQRFLMNTNRINGWIQIPDKGDLLIITKSLKDVIVLDHFNIPAISMQAETQTPYDYIIDELKSRFKRIISLFDYDRTGITRAEILSNMYDIPYFFIQDEEAKDISDYIKEYGFEQTKTFLNNHL